MKAFLVILFLAAIGGGAYYWFVLKDQTPGDLLAPDRSAAASGTDSNGNNTPGGTNPKQKSPPRKVTGPKTASKSGVPAKMSKPPLKKPEAPKSEIDLFVEKKYPMPIIHPLATITKNWSAVPPRAYPPQITATEAVPLDLIVNGQKIGASNVLPGKPLKPLLLQGDQLTVSNPANTTMRNVIHVDKTDFKQLIEMRYGEFIVFKKNQIETMRSKAKQALLAQPDRLASLRITGPGDPSEDPRFAPVKASINRGEAHPASLDEVVSFKWNGSERVGGQMRGTYDTVSVHFEVATIFGKFPTDYKCLLQAGQVKGWIDPITEEKITK